MRKVQIIRETKETKIKVDVNLDGSGRYNISTGVGFLDHMLEQLSKHSGVDIDLQAEGDTHIDAHHTCEDIGIALGQAFRKALGEKRGVNRFASKYVPMDETLTRVVLDLSGRPYVVFDVSFSQDKLGELDTELIREWFFAFGQNLMANLHVTNLYGVNNHHKAESCFKALALAVKDAITVQSGNQDIPSTKGTI